MNSPQMTQLLAGVIFGLFVTATVGGACLAVFTSRVIRSVCGLAMCSLGLAGLYYFLRSPFLALMEILIYVGAVCVTIVFAIMLAEPVESQKTERSASGRIWGGLAALVSAVLFWSLARLAQGAEWIPPATRTTDGSVRAIGTALLTTYSLAFELISLVLMVAILGSLAIARSGRSKS
jgi:NADH:ubiquinone oxidoreductase subunit 6 (subunit J)